MNSAVNGACLGIVMLLSLTGCGGGSGGSSLSSASSSLSSNSSSSSLSLATRSAAATATAQNNAACTAVAPFYWEIGDGVAVRGSGSTGDGSVTADTTMLIASASKWLFGAYVEQLRAGQLTDDDIRALTMNAGYTNLTYGSCLVGKNTETVNQCFTAAHLTGGNNNDYTDADNNHFYYNGGHFQWLAVTDLGLGDKNNMTLHDSIAAQLGTEIEFTYDSPQLAAGVSADATNYAVFLRKILNNQLRMHDALGTNPVCTNPTTCSTATYTPIPSSESWHYSIAHWVEDDPSVGDGAFSSPGAFGFYPWIDAGKTWYGILARYDSSLSATDPVAVGSVDCGRLIRKAWLTGVQQ
jgi:hypothetical protein